MQELPIQPFIHSKIGENTETLIERGLAIEYIVNNNVDKIKELLELKMINKNMLEPKTFLSRFLDVIVRENPKTLLEVAKSLKRKEIVELFLKN